jgi:hypothetical protein
MMLKDCGNAAAMREALKKIGAMEIPHNFQIERSDIVDACYDLTKAIKIANAALAAPPRNCDVGTAVEQYERHEAYCEKQDMYCLNDDIFNCRMCFTKWAQMPYEEGGSK